MAAFEVPLPRIRPDWPGDATAAPPTPPIPRLRPAPPSASGQGDLFDLLSNSHAVGDAPAPATNGNGSGGGLDGLIADSHPVTSDVVPRTPIPSLAKPYGNPMVAQPPPATPVASATPAAPAVPVPPSALSSNPMVSHAPQTGTPRPFGPMMPTDASPDNVALGAVGRIIKAGADAFGDQQIGMEIGGETETFFRNSGIFGPGPIQQANEAIIRPVAAALDAVSRAFSAGGAELGQATEELVRTVNTVADDPHFAGDPAAANREVNNFVNYLMTRFAEAPVHGAPGTPEPRPIDYGSDVNRFLSSADQPARDARAKGVGEMFRQATEAIKPEFPALEPPRPSSGDVPTDAGPQAPEPRPPAPAPPPEVTASPSGGEGEAVSGTEPPLEGSAIRRSGTGGQSPEPQAIEPQTPPIVPNKIQPSGSVQNLPVGSGNNRPIAPPVIAAGPPPATAGKSAQSLDDVTKGLTDIFDIRDVSKPAGTRVTPAAVTTPEELAHATAVVNTEPSPAQKTAGVYQKGHIKLHGLNISIENPKGSIRSAADGSWSSPPLPAAYGYVKRTEAADGDQVDVYVGDNPSSDRAFVIDQTKPDGSYDEPKIVLGASTKAEAAKLYQGSFSDKIDHVGGVTKMSIPELRGWLKSGPIDKPISTLPRSAYVQKKNARIQRVAQHEAAVSRPEGQGISALRGEGDRSVPAVAREPRSVHEGHGAAADATALDRPEGRQEGVRAGQLPVGDQRGAVAESAGIRGAPDGARENANDRRVVEGGRNTSSNDLQSEAARSGGRGVPEQKGIPERQSPTSAHDISGGNAGAANVGSKGGRAGHNAGAAPAARMEHRKGSEHATKAHLLDVLKEIGLKDDPELRALKLGGLSRQIIRKSGKSLDKAREHLAELGYFDHLYGPRERAMAESTPSDLLDMIKRAVRGEKIYPSGGEPVGPSQAKQEREADRHAAAVEEINAYLAENDIPDVDATFKDRIAAVMINTGMSASEAVDHALADLDHEELSPDAIKTRDDSLPPRWEDDTHVTDQNQPPPRRNEERENGGGPDVQGREGRAEAVSGKAPDRSETARPEGSQVEPGADNKPQTIILGAEKRPGAAAQRLADQPLKPKAAQKPTDEGLFGDAHKQTDLIDQLRQPPKAAPKDEFDDIFSKAVEEQFTPVATTDHSLDAVAKGLDGIFGKGFEAPSEPFADPAKYERAKPFFKAGLQHFAAPDADLTTMVRGLIKHLAETAKMDRLAIEAMKPYIRQYVEDVASGKESLHAPSPSGGVEPDSGNAAPTDRVGATDVSAATGRTGTGAGERGGPPDQAGGIGDGRGGVPENGAPAVGAGGNLELPPRQPRPSAGPESGPGGRSGGDNAGQPGLSPDRTSEEETARVAERRAELNERRKAQARAEPIEVKPLDPANIDATLPMLFPEQRGDVLKAEKRYAMPDGHGMMLTNGTGTGKTFSGLGVIKRLSKAGKDQILVVAPSQGVLLDWKRAARDFLLDAHILDGLDDGGLPGLNMTTYANLGLNSRLADKAWDLVVADEAHKLSSDQNGNPTIALHTFRALTGHPAGFNRRAQMVFRKEWDEYEKLDSKSQEGAKRRAYEAWKAKADPAQAKWANEPRPKALMLSASPFAYHYSLDYAEGYLFDYPPENQKTIGGWSHVDPRSEWYVRNLGYRIRYGKLTSPEADVNLDIMERQVHENLKKTGALSGRQLQLDVDYDRKFVLVDDAIGKQIDQALSFLQEADNGKFRHIYEMVGRKFDYLSRMRLLEAIKARHAIPYIKDSINRLGRKVVVFHDYNEGGGFSPFDLIIGADQDVYVGDKKIKLKPLFEEFLARNPYVKNLDFAGYRAPIAELTAAFPDALVYNGTVSAGKRDRIKAEFNDDTSGKDLIIIQSAAGEFGISLHDITGPKAGGHQRTLLNLGMPIRPVSAIQQEGRIYREGSQSDAVYRYMNTGTNWERWTYAGKIAERAGTAENLAMGDVARQIRQSFIDAFEDTADNPPSPDDGKGGKAADRGMYDALSEFERAKTHYFANQKKAKGKGGKEGIDYFATPEPLGLKMVEWSGIRPNEKILEPSAGHGAISRYFPETSNRTLVEPSSELASRAALSSPGARVVVDRFENLNVGANKFHAIVMNPPFGHGGATAFDHLEKAVSHLVNGGRIVAVVPTGPAADKRFEKFADAHTDLWAVADFHLPSVTFERAGTAVSARVLVIEKQTDQATSNQLAIPIIRNLTDAGTIGEFFDRIENVTVPPRLEPITKEAVETPAAQPAASEPGAPITGVNFTTAETVHGKTGENLFVASIKGRVERPLYDKTLAVAKRYGGYYSAFKGAGAIPGFQFKTAASRQAFIDEVKGTPPNAGLAEHKAPFESPKGWEAVEGNPSMIPPAETAALKNPHRRIDLGEFKWQPGVPRGRQMQEYVVSKGKEHGVEFLVAVDGQGTQLTLQSGTRDHTGLFPPAMEEAMQRADGNVVAHHNHPSDSGFSKPDILHLAFPGLKALWAHGHRGYVGRIALTEEFADRTRAFSALQRWKALEGVNDVAARMLYDAILPAVRARRIDSILAGQINQHLITVALRDAGVLDYRSTFDDDPGRQALVDEVTAQANLTPHMKAIVERIRSAVDDLGKAQGYGPIGRTGGRTEPLRHVGDLGAAFSRSREAPRGVGQGDATPQRAGDGRAEAGRDARPVQLRLPGFSESFPPDQQESLKNDLQAMATRIMGKRVPVVFEPVIPAEWDQVPAADRYDSAIEAGGFVQPKTHGGYIEWNGIPGHSLIAIATGTADPRTAMGHEAWHHVWKWLLTDAEHTILQADLAKGDKSKLRQMAAQEWRVPVTSPLIAQMPDMELSAFAFQRYRRAHEEGGEWGRDEGGLHIALRRFFNRLMELFRQITKMLGRKELGINDIFAETRSGEMARRDVLEPDNVAGFAAPSNPFSRAAAPPPPRDASWDAIRSRIGDKPSRRGMLSRMSWGKVYAAVKDDIDPFKVAERYLQKLSNRAMPASASAYVRARLSRATAFNKLAEWVDGGGPERYQLNLDGPPTRVGKPLKEILAPLRDGDHFDSWVDYMVAKRAIEKAAQGIETGVPLDQAREVVRQGEAFYGPIGDSFHRDWSDHVIQYAIDSGRLTPEGAAAIRAMNQDWIPYHRLFDTGEDDKPLGSRRFRVGNPLKRMKGSDLMIENPMHTIIKNAFAVLDTAERNTVLRLLDDSVQAVAASDANALAIMEPIRMNVHPITVTEAEVARFMRDNGIIGNAEDFLIFRPNQFHPDKNIVRFYKNGKAQYRRVPDEIGSAINGLDRHSMGVVLRMLTLPTRTLRAGAINAPEFVGRHLFRSDIMAAINSRNYYIPFVSMLHGLVHLTAQTDAFHVARSSGALNAAMVTMDQKAIAGIIRGVKGPSILNRAIRAPLHPLKLIQDITSYLDNARRMGEFAQARMRGKSVAQSAYDAREVFGDYLRKGTWGGQVARFVAFFNADFEGLDRNLRAFNPRSQRSKAAYDRGNTFYKTLFLTLALVTLPSIALWLSQHNDPRMKHVNPRMRDLFWIWFTDDWQNVSADVAEGYPDYIKRNLDGQWQVNHGIMHRLPKPFALGVLFGSLPERILDAVVDKRPHAFDGLLGSLGYAFLPQIIPTVLSPVLDQVTNYNWFLHNPLIPPSQQDIEPKYQGADYTSDTAKLISRALSKIPYLGDTSTASPYVIEDYISQWTGTLGRYAVSASDKVLQASGVTDAKVQPSDTEADMPILKGFSLRYPSASALPIQEFYEHEKVEMEREKTFKYLIKNGQKEEAAKVGRGLVQGIFNEQGPLGGFVKILSTQRKTLHAIYQDPKLSPDDKRKLVDQTYFHMIDTAEAANRKWDEARGQ